jgi:hypothetical protein
LAALLSSELQRLGDVEESAQELNALEYARRLAEAQQLAERTARAVDAGQSAQQQEAAMRAIQDQAVTLPITFRNSVQPFLSQMNHEIVEKYTFTRSFLFWNGSILDSRKTSHLVCIAAMSRRACPLLPLKY